MKFVRPLYRDLYAWEEKRQQAIDTFKAHRLLHIVHIFVVAAIVVFVIVVVAVVSRFAIVPNSFSTGHSTCRLQMFINNKCKCH